MKKIVNLKGLAEITKRHRTRLHALILEGRLKPDYRDNDDVPYWKEKRAYEIAQMIEEQSKNRTPGRGSKFVFDKLDKEDEEGDE